MANFKILEDGEDISSFDLPLNRTVKLLQWGGDYAGNKLQIELNAPNPALVLTVLPDKQSAASTAFTLTGKVSGAAAQVCAYINGTKDKFSENLNINIKGDPHKQNGYAVDLLSDLATKGDAKKIRLYTRIMTNPEHLLKQDTRAGHYNCGDVSAGYGKRLFSQPTNTTYFQYYLTPTTSNMDDLRFNPQQMMGSIARIQSSLNQGTSVRVWLIHDDGFQKHITTSDPTHFVTIIGHGGNKFLYIDPWPDGSKFPYDGGMYPVTNTRYIGQLEFDPTNLHLGIRHSAVSRGSMPYTVIAGP